MNQNKLDDLLTLVKNESIDIKTIDYKTKCLIHNIPKHFITPKASFITALALLVFVSILGYYQSYQQQQNQIAMDQLKQERATVVDSEYLYTTLVSSYETMLGENHE
ncbi:MAG: hypothetical protein ACRCWI_07455 [Brevinema sp.]